MQKIIDNYKKHKLLYSIGVIIVVVLVSNILYISNFRYSDPLFTRSDLLTHTAAGFTSGVPTIDPNDGFTAQALGHAAAKQWISGHIPYWNPYEGVGSPLAGEMQSAAFFPLVLLLYFSNGLLYMHVLLEIIAGAGAYLFFRKLKLSNTAALAGGIAFSISATFVWLTNAVVNPIAFLPWMMLGIDMICVRTEKKISKIGITILAVSLSMSLYAGFPEVAYIDALLAYIWGVFRLIQYREKYKSNIIFLFVGSLLGLMIAAPILVSFVDYLPYANTADHASSLNNAALVGAGFSAIFMPYIYGPIFGFINHSKNNILLDWWSSVGGYLSSVGLVASIMGFFTKRNLPEKIVLSAWIILALSKIYGLWPLDKIIGFIPGISVTAFYRYGIVSVEFSVIALTALAIDDILRGFIRNRYKVLSAIIALVCILVSAVLSRPELNELIGSPHRRLWTAASICWAIFAILSFTIVAVMLKKRVKATMIVLVVTIDALLMYGIPQLSAQRNEVINLSPVSYLQKNIGNYRFFTTGPIQPNYGSYFGISSADINDLPIPKSYGEYITKYLDNNVNPIVFTGSNQTIPFGPSPLQEFFKNINNYESIGVKYLVTNTGIVSNTEQTTYDLKIVFNEAPFIIFKLPNPYPFYQEAINESCSLSHETLYGLTADCKNPTLLTRSELYMPGWSANINGKQVTIKPTSNGLFQNIKLPIGEDKVIFSYSPKYILVGWILCFISLVTLVTIFLVPLKFKRFK